MKLTLAIMAAVGPIIVLAWALWSIPNFNLGG